MNRKPAVGWDLNVGRLVQLELAFLGPGLIVGEYAVGVVLPLVFAGLSLSYAVRTQSPILSWPVLLGLELVAIGLNYVPLLIEAWRGHSDRDRIALTRSEIRRDSAEARAYGLRQLWILVPAAIIAFELRRSAPRVVAHSGAGLSTPAAPAPAVGPGPPES